MNIAYIYEDDPLFERKIENAATGLKPTCKKILKRVSKTNAVIVADYITSMQTEMNPSDDYKKAIIMLLYKFSQINKDKTFKQMTRQDVISFLDRLRKPETAFFIERINRIRSSFNKLNLTLNLLSRTCIEKTY